ncbi:MAG: DUF4157 domain-containing protein [Reyranella sp.]|uniref:eCIS core domain-containing protein n=1 Tax=Reyranella sp. TaxID=1929291 RepID=UPI003D13F8E6
MTAASPAAPATASRPSAGPRPRLVQRKCMACAKEHAPGECLTCKRRTVQRRSLGTGANGMTPAMTERVGHALDRSGRALDSGVRDFMERRFGTSFGNVSIHDNAASHRAARVLGAEAFTSGQQIHFGAGRYRPGNRDGLNLIAHELAHTIQQRSLPGSGGSVGMELGAADSPLERDADSAAERAMAGAPIDIRQFSGRPVIQRKGSAAVEELDDLLSYGLFDWAITDAEAIEALTKLKGLPRIEQAEFMSDPKFADRLRDNLPDDRKAEFDVIKTDVSNMLPANSTVEDIIDKLSYGLFDWAITDKEAIEALDLLKTLSGEQLAITLKRINHARLMDNLPEDRQQELIDLLAAGLGSSGTFPTSESKEPGTALRSLDFVSDHAVMRDNSKDWTNKGKAFPQPDWAISKKGETRSGAISHRMGQQVQVELGFDVTPASAAASNATITGKGSSPFLDFDFTGSLSGGAGKKVPMTSPNKVPDGVAAFPRQQIDWSIKWGSWDHALGTTGPFDVYATVDKPARPAEVTTKRMAKAVEMVASAPSLNPHDVVKQIMFTWTKFNLDVQYANEWDIAADLQKGAQCIDLVRFVQSVISTVGLPGTAEAVVVWAKPATAMTAIETPWGAPGSSGMSSRLFPGFPGQPSWRAALLDGDFRPNNYEAALKFTDGGTTKYYPGGVPSVLDSPDEVLRVFNCLSWFRVTGGDSYEITNVPGPYQPGECNVGDSHSFSGT